MKKIISIILAILCICGTFAVVSFADNGGIYDGFLPVNKDPAWAAKAIDADGKLKTPDFYESYSGVYFVCQNTEKYYIADKDVCPYCGQKAYHYGKNNEMKTFQNSDLFRLKFAIYCDSCEKCILGNFDTMFESQSAISNPRTDIKEAREIAEKYKYLWTKGYSESGNANCPNCGEAALSSKWEIQWIYYDECHYITCNNWAMNWECLNAGGPQASEWKESAFDFSKDPDKQDAGDLNVLLNFWQMFIQWIKNLFASVAGLFS